MYQALQRSQDTDSSATVLHDAELPRVWAQRGKPVCSGFKMLDVTLHADYGGAAAAAAAASGQASLSVGL